MSNEEYWKQRALAAERVFENKNDWLLVANVIPFHMEDVECTSASLRYQALKIERADALDKEIRAFYSVKEKIDEYFKENKKV